MVDVYKIIVVGEKPLVLGYRLLGCTECYEETGEEGARRVISLLKRNDIGMIIASDIIRDSMSQQDIEKIESTIQPLVIFVPSSVSVKKSEEEVLREYVKRVLGIDIGV
ncbi:MAG: V-type ATP synthase subunit F [Thermoplasmata archaeon]|jgi:V/A-type H+-transporting ATPase subunit F|nr:hypothetical protein [Thermoplasmata archaeon]MVT13670.1 hypothetical protein [Euryarchaeota archaeon]MVT15147.1 hypothetical protein [Euryarchaeota archaeon]MVT36436.1 hypothetical protein [Euryarchaeota archaeon]